MVNKPHCGRCGSRTIIKYGVIYRRSTGERLQRHLCYDCGSTFVNPHPLPYTNDTYRQTSRHPAQTCDAPVESVIIPQLNRFAVIDIVMEGE
jgi:hypothetical protein